MRTATMSVLGLYQYDPTIFEGLALPNTVDKENLIVELVTQLSSLEVLYPNAPLMKSIITAWSYTRVQAWERVADALLKEYNVIHNYDRNETHTETHTRTEDWSDEGEASNTRNVNAYNSVTARQAENNSGSSTASHSGTITDERSNTINVAGNIGVTTSQQMIEAEMNLRKLDIYKYIIEEFKQRFCILVY